jgi:hypothetical protein
MTGRSLRRPTRQVLPHLDDELVAHIHPPNLVTLWRVEASDTVLSGPAAFSATHPDLPCLEIYVAELKAAPFTWPEPGPREGEYQEVYRSGELGSRGVHDPPQFLGGEHGAFDVSTALRGRRLEEAPRPCGWVGAE